MNRPWRPINIYTHIFPSGCSISRHMQAYVKKYVHVCFSGPMLAICDHMSKYTICLRIMMHSLAATTVFSTQAWLSDTAPTHICQMFWVFDNMHGDRIALLCLSFVTEYLGDGNSIDSLFLTVRVRGDRIEPHTCFIDFPVLVEPSCFNVVAAARCRPLL